MYEKQPKIILYVVDLWIKWSCNIVHFWFATFGNSIMQQTTPIIRKNIHRIGSGRISRRNVFKGGLYRWWLESIQIYHKRAYRGRGTARMAQVVNDMSAYNARCS